MASGFYYTGMYTICIFHIFYAHLSPCWKSPQVKPYAPPCPALHAVLTQRLSLGRAKTPASANPVALHVCKK